MAGSAGGRDIRSQGQRTKAASGRGEVWQKDCFKEEIVQAGAVRVDLFTGRVTRGPKKGIVRSFPICGQCAVQRDCKIRPIQRYQKTLPPGTVQYIGYAQDEQERLLLYRTGRMAALRGRQCH